MDDTGNTRDDLKVPEGDTGEEIKNSINDGKDILVSKKSKSIHIKRYCFASAFFSIFNSCAFMLMSVLKH